MLLLHNYLIYCIEVWGSACQTHQQPLFLVHQFVRIITFSHYLALTQPLFNYLFLLPLDRLILNRIRIIMYTICNGLLPEVINALYVRNKYIHSYNTRSRNLLRVPKGSTNFVNISTQLWKVLMLNIDVNVSITTFKHYLKTYLLHNTVELKYPR